MIDDLPAIAAALEVAVAASRGLLSRAGVVRETSSTQDLAARTGPSTVVLAGIQTAGRGRLGRAWSDPEGLGIAMTLALSLEVDAAQVSLAAGVAAARACERFTPELGLRWPNDVVERAGGRKLAGILIERRAGLTLIGIGINVLHQASDWPPLLQGRAVSLRELGRSVTRPEVAGALVAEVVSALRSTPGDLRSQWQHRDVLTGSRHSFAWNGQRFEGMVEDVDPACRIMLRLGSGELLALPALSTSLEKDAPIAHTGGAVPVATPSPSPSAAPPSAAPAGASSSPGAWTSP